MGRNADVTTRALYKEGEEGGGHATHGTEVLLR